jgi:FkbM family methyltransferase
MMADMLRRLPIFKGKQRLARILLRNQIKSKKNLSVLGRGNCRYLLPNVEEIIGFEIWINGIFEPEVVRYLCSRIKPGSIFIDLGANIGTICLPVAKARPDISIVAVEAAPDVVTYLLKNIEINELRNVEAVAKAMARRGQGQIDFFPPELMFGKGSLAPVFTAIPVKVNSISLDDLASQFELKKVSMIKADLEGFEATVFEGGKNLLSSIEAPDVLFEFVDWAEKASGGQPGLAQQVLLDYGYNLFRFDHGKPKEQINRPIISGDLMILASKK